MSVSPPDRVRVPASTVTDTPRLLVSSLPEVGVRYAERRLRGIPGRPPSLLNPPSGCRFRDRCPLATARCTQEPPWIEENGRGIACWEAAATPDATPDATTDAPLVAGAS